MVLVFVFLRFFVEFFFEFLSFFEFLKWSLLWGKLI